jgi:hypothetical protein
MFDDVYVEGHGACTALALAALATLDDAGLLAPRRRVTCYSMASVLAVAMALGASPRALLRRATESGLQRLGAPTLVACALLRGARLRLSARLLALIDACGVGPELTMGALHERSGHRVRVLVACAATARTYVVDERSAPAALVRDVLLASCAIPGVFEFDGVLFDGAIFGGFGDAALEPGPGALVIGARCGVRAPTLQLVAAYRTLLSKLQAEWRAAALARGAEVLLLRAGGDEPLHVRSVDGLYAYGASRTIRWISSRLDARAEPRRADARTYSDASGGEEQSRSSRPSGVSSDAASSSAAMSPTRVTSV